MAARPAPSRPTGNAGHRASSAPFSAAPAARTPSGAAPATAPQAGMIGGTTTPMINPMAMARPSPWQMASSMIGAGGYRGQGATRWPFRAPPSFTLSRHDRPIRTGRPAEAFGGAPEAAPGPHHLARSRALRGPLRPSHAGDALLRDARSDGDHGPAGGDLARRRPPGHVDLPVRALRGADDADRARVLRGGSPVRPDGGIRGDQGLHPRGDGRGGDGARPRRPDRHHGRPAGDRPDRQDP